jgi:hypothetical protein
VIDTKLEVGEVAIVVNITDTSPLATPTTATTFRQLSGQELVQVPTSTRSFTHLLSAEAGVSSDLPPVLTNGNGNISPSVNGTRTTSTSLTFNGIDATNLTSNEGSLSDNIAPAPETLSEVKLQTSLYDASTGRSGGGNFQLVTKSGGNRINGSIYHYLQNEKLNANDYFFNRDGLDRPKARRNEGGSAHGGEHRCCFQATQSELPADRSADFADRPADSQSEESGDGRFHSAGSALRPTQNRGGSNCQPLDRRQSVCPAA